MLKQIVRYYVEFWKREGVRPFWGNGIETVGICDRLEGSLEDRVICGKSRA